MARDDVGNLAWRQLRAPTAGPPRPEPPINELPEPDVLDETSAGLARHSVGERVRVLEAVVSQASSQNVPVGVSTPSKPSRSAVRATSAR